MVHRPPILFLKAIPGPENKAEIAPLLLFPAGEAPTCTFQTPPKIPVPNEDCPFGAGYFSFLTEIEVPLTIQEELLFIAET
jgi:hypothetical protein